VIYLFIAPPKQYITKPPPFLRNQTFDGAMNCTLRGVFCRCGAIAPYVFGMFTGAAQ